MVNRVAAKSNTTSVGSDKLFRKTKSRKRLHIAAVVSSKRLHIWLGMASLTPCFCLNMHYLLANWRDVGVRVCADQLELVSTACWVELDVGEVTTAHL